MKTITATTARSNLFTLIKDTAKKHLFTRISTKDGAAILLSEEEFESLVETAELLSIPGFKDSIKQADKEIDRGEVLDFEAVFDA